MRHISALLAFCLSSLVHAQLVNGSFEDQFGNASFSGWNMDCECSMPTSSTDVPGGTGDWSMRMNSSDVMNSCICFLSGFNRQAVPWLTPGDWHLTGWIKGVGPDGADGTRVMVLSGLDYSSPNTLGEISTLDSVWAYRSLEFTVPEDVDPDSLFVALFADGVSGNEVLPVFFDDIQLSQDINTTIQDGTGPEPVNTWPNPANDKLWVGLAEAPTSVTVVDASGRTRPMPTFHHNGHTLEVEVSSIPTGLCVMLLKSASGFRMLRFIKT